MACSRKGRATATLTTGTAAANVVALAQTHLGNELRGLLAGAGCFVFWGLVAVYWKQLGHVPPVELVLHRTVWSFGFLVWLLRRRGRLGRLVEVWRDRRLLLPNLLSGGLLMGNWLVFLWAVEQRQLLEASLGYFLVPLFHVGAGYLLLGERPRPWQWLSILMAIAGVGWLLVGVGHVPWVALLLVGTWGPYGLVRKSSPMGALDGLAMETLLFTPVAIVWLGWLAVRGSGALGQLGGWDTVLLLSSGWITSVPLVWFAYAAARIPMTTLGLLQYLSPSLQFLLGWLVYGEALEGGQLPGYVAIWCGLSIYVAEGWWSRRLRRAV